GANLKQTIIVRLAKADPANAGWQRHLAMSRSGVATALAEQGEREQALQTGGGACHDRPAQSAIARQCYARQGSPLLRRADRRGEQASHEIPSWHCRSYTPSPTADRMAIANPRLHLALHSALTCRKSIGQLRTNERCRKSARSPQSRRSCRFRS